jgi:glycerol-3-phosphate dehydrogenase
VSEAEINYLLDAYNHYFQRKANKDAVIDKFSGVRPLIKSASNPSQATREYVIEKRNHLITVFGGKWTTARALARKVKTIVEQQ